MYQKIITWALVVSGIFFAVPVPAAAVSEQAPEAAVSMPEVSAKSAVVVNADNGEILFEKNADEKRAMASTTKIMTAMLALEHAKTDNQLVTITDPMVRVEGSSMGLRAGDKLTLQSIAAGMLVVSGNDAANSAAIAVSGSAEAFADLMNRRAAELGMASSHFVTPSGLDDDAHYSTAKDMATLACAALKNPDFAEIVGQKSMSVSFVSPDKTVRFTNHNKLLSQYEGCIGVKTGFTKKAGRCLVSAAERDGIRLVAVTLCAPNDWEDHKKLLDYGFSQLVSIPVDDSACRWQLPVVGGQSEQMMVSGAAGVPVILRRDRADRLERIVELPRFIYAPVKTGQTIGTVRYSVDGVTVAATPLVAQSGCEEILPPKTLRQKISEFFQHLLP